MRNLRIITLVFLVICLPFAKNALANPWHLSLHAQGQGLQVSRIEIGMDRNDQGVWPGPPLMPNFAAVIRIWEPNKEENYHDDIRSEGSIKEEWYVDVKVGEQPPLVGDLNAGSVADADQPGFWPSIFWNPNDMVSDGFMQIRLGDSIVVDNMKTTSSYQTTQDDALATGSYDPENNFASMRYKVTFWASYVDTQDIELVPGWNWVSFYVLPEDTSLGALFGIHEDKIDQVKTQTRSATNVPGLGWIGDDLNLMSNISNGAMFKIKTNAETSFTLSVTGSVVSPYMTIPLQQNWTWIAYLPSSACLSVEDVVFAITDVADFYQIKTQTASRTNIGETSPVLIGDLTEMCPGQGIVVKMNATGSLVYPAP